LRYCISLNFWRCYHW